MKRLTTAQRNLRVTRMKSRIPKDPVQNGKIRGRRPEKEAETIYGVDVMNSTTPPQRSRWIAVETDEGWETYYEDAFPGQDQGWQRIPKGMIHER